MTDRATPTLLTLTDVVAVAAGDDHSLALTASGQLFAWGLNDLGQLGTGDTTNASVPVQVATGVLSIGAGGRFSLFVKSDGTVWGTGDNQWGMLGNGSYTNRTSPGQMSSVTKAVAVQGGSQHSLILLQNGTVWSTGRNNFGQMGVAFPAYRNTAAVMGSLSNIVTIAAGDNFSLALDKDGVVWGWGDNASGQLGSAAPSYRTIPAIVGGLSGIKYIAAGAGHTIAANANRTISSVGANASGQLGDGTTTNRSTPLASDGLSERLATPTLSVSTGTFESEFNVVVTAGSANSVLRYTTNGAEPTESDPTVASGSTIAIDHSLSLKVKAWQTDWLPSAVAAATYEMRVATPSLSPGSSTLTAPTGISISTLTSGTVIRYTVDGSDPTSSAPSYTGPITVATATTMKARGFKASWSDSAAGVASYVMNLGTLATPSIAPATGTYAVGLTAVISGTQPGATIRYTTDGSSPTGSSPIYTSALQIDASPSTITAKAFHPDYTASEDASRVYTLVAPPPKIEPATGTFTTAQAVTITASAGAVIRYSTDGSDPNEASSLYSGPLTVDTGLMVKARAFPSNGWAASATASATLTFSYGTLDQPGAAPAGGVFATSPQVTLSSISGAQIFYTLNGSTPTAGSTLYSGPVAILATGATLKSIAIHPDWTASTVRTDVYVVDTTAPTITAKYFPAQLNAWNRSPVTVSFHCFDSAEVASCSSPSEFSEEGAGQTLVGTAVDSVGNQAQLPLTLNLDLTPPTVTLTSPINGIITTNPTLQVTGEAADLLSGLASVTCNDVAATVVDGAVACDVTLRPGRNVVVIAARDVAGNSVSEGVTATLTGTVTQLYMSPAERVLLVGEATTLSLRDDFGLGHSLAAWQTSDSAIVSLSSDDPPVLTAVAEGQVTILATKDGTSASTQVSVVAGVGPEGSLPAGTTRWKIHTPTSTQSRRTAPIYTRRVDADGPDLFTVEPNFTTNEYTVRAVSAEGGVLWKEAAPGLPLMGDSYGALIAGVEKGAYRCALYYGEDSFCFTALVRFGGSENALPWRYDSAGYLDRPAQGPDGTIYAIEHIDGARYFSPGPFPDYGNNKSIVILNGSTGQVTARVPLAPENSEWEPRTVGPIVGSDGNAYMLVHKSVSADESWTLLTLSRTGQIASVVVDECHISCGGLIEPKQLVPDGTGGLLIRAEAYLTGGNHEGRLIRFDADDQRTEHVLPTFFTRIELVGSGGTVYLQTQIGTDPYGTTQALDVRNWTSLWSKSPGLTLVAARDDGGAAAQNPAGELVPIDESGAFGESQPLDLIDPVPDSGGLTGNRSGELAVVSSKFVDKTVWNASLTAVGELFEPRAFGNSRLQSAAQISDCEAPYLTDLSQGSGEVKGLRLNTQYTYAFDMSTLWEELDPHGAPLIDFAKVAIWIRAAFQMWQDANIVSGLNATFTEAPFADAKIKLRLKSQPSDDPGQPASAAGSFGGTRFQTDRTLSTGNIHFYLINTESPEFFFKVTLHELGHAHGLNDSYPYTKPGRPNFGFEATSVMNQKEGREDAAGNIAPFVTECDRKAARDAADRVWP